MLEELQKISREVLACHSREGTYEWVSDSALTVFGYAPEELLGKNPYDFFHEDDKSRVLQESHEIALGGELVQRIQLRFRHKEGHFIWIETLTKPIFDVSGEVVQLHTSSRVVEDYMKLLGEMDKNERLHKESDRLAKVGGWELDLGDMNLIWSEQVRAIHEVPDGYSPELERALGFYAPDYRQMVTDAVDKSMKTGETIIFESKLITYKKRVIWVRAVIRAILRDGKPVKLYGAFQDIDQEKKIQIFIEEKNKDLRRLSKEMAEQNQQLLDFNHITSHNLRSPVANLMVLSEILKTPEEEEQQKIVEGLRKSIHLLNETLEHLVEALRVNDSKGKDFVLIDVKQMTEKVLLSLGSQIKDSKAKIQLELEEVSHVKYPRVYFESLLLNLVSNAIKYHKPGEVPRVVVRTLRENGRDVLEVKDQGLGIDLKKHGDKIFGLYKTFHRHPEAKGLGLFMTKSQVVALGGKIDVESEPGKGTSFKVTLGNSGI